MEIEPLHELPGDRSGQRAMATSLTPGTAWSVSAICDHDSGDWPRGVLGFEEQEVLWAPKPEGSAGEMAGGGDEEPGEKEDDETEGDLRGDQRIHGSAFGVRLLAAFESGDRLNGGRTQAQGGVRARRAACGRRE